MTVLTNRDGVLPLAAAPRVALIGRHAVETIDMGGGSAQVNPPYQVSVAEGLGRAARRRGHRDRRRRGAHPAGAGPAASFVTDPATGEPGVRVHAATPPTARCSTSGTARRGQPLVGFDDDFAATPAHAVRSAARLGAAGAGRDRRASASGRWARRAPADQTRQLRAASAPAASARRCSPRRRDRRGRRSTATGDRRGRRVIAASPARHRLAGVGLFGLVARPAPATGTRSSPTRSPPPPRPTSRSSSSG